MTRRRRRRGKKLPEEPVLAEIESLSHDGRGVTRIDGKTTFVHGALPGEEVKFKYTSIRKDHDEGDTVEVLRASPTRVAPVCKSFGVCGGCSLQHLDTEAQILAKQQTLIDSLQRIGKVAPIDVMPPLVSESPWGYRRKARLGVKNVIKKGRVLVGFRERSSSFITNVDSCPVLHPQVGENLESLSDLIGQLSIASKLPQIEVAMDDVNCVLVFRVLEPPTDADIDKLRQYGEKFGFFIYLQPGGPDSVMPLGEGIQLNYQLPDFDVEFDFLPTDFTQVNTSINRQMVKQAVDLLDPQPGERILDLFCGLGNFTLPIAKRGAITTGVEGDEGLVERARHNAGLNDISAEFFTANLYDSLDEEPWLNRDFDKALLDPPRSGAQQILEYLPKMGINKIVYVSCYPGTLARDADILVNQLGYTMTHAGVMDMFPHTAHVESMAVFVR
ncbi:MAG: 23S rRNA (uracil(1939)-C(5))-methyltransferase RlmD [bacterium]